MLKEQKQVQEVLQCFNKYIRHFEKSLLITKGVRKVLKSSLVASKVQ